MGSRRRGSALEAALLDAAWEELQTVGYAKLTMEGVAQRAGTSRPVLARRWRSQPELVIAALGRHRPMLSGEVPDTGSLRGDVLALLRRASAGITEIGPETIYGLIGDYFADPELVPDLQSQLLRIGTEIMPGVFGQIGMEYGHRYGGTSFELFARISEKNHSHSTLNPKAAYTKKMSLEQIMGDIMIAYPNTRPMCSANCDGAAAAPSQLAEHIGRVLG